MKLTQIKGIEGKILLKSGLHIGAGDMEMHIGGTDSTVMKHPHTQDPYIPGSSIKGKVRSLLEMRSGLMGKTNGKVLEASDLSNISDRQQKAEAMKILQIFGFGGDSEKDSPNIGPSRAAFFDCFLDRKWLKKAKENRWDKTEVKAENSIDRIKGTALSPRFIERVPEGAEFSFKITLKVFEGDDDLLGFLLEGIRLLEMDALGGSGTRGYGRVAFEFADSEIQSRFKELKPFNE